MGMALGYCAAMGTLLPPVVKLFLAAVPGLDIVQIATTLPVAVTLLGCLITLAGIGVTAKARAPAPGLHCQSPDPQTTAAAARNRSLCRAFEADQRAVLARNEAEGRSDSGSAANCFAAAAAAAGAVVPRPVAGCGSSGRTGGEDGGGVL